MIIRKNRGDSIIVRILVLCSFLWVRSTSTSYDYVVVGGGSTGSVVGRRLAEAGFDVMILEAGSPTQEALGGCSVPNNCPFMRGGDRNLSVFDVPLEWLDILENRSIRDEYEWTIQSPEGPTGVPAQARGLGGCGIHNAMIYIRGTPLDFAEQTAWGRMNWTWDQVLPAYMKSENNTAFGAPYHGTAGPVQISHASVRSAFAERFLDACEKVSGIPRNSDFNGALREGCGHYQFLVRDGIRDSTAVAYLGRDRSREERTIGRLDISTLSRASRIVFDDDTNASLTAVAVEYVDVRSNTTLVVRARKEIIVSCGAIHTPKLLLRSGIGASEKVLQKKSAVELPDVGENLMDGVYLIMQFAVGNGTRFDDKWEHCWANTETPACDAARSAYASNRSGLYSSPGLSVGGFLRSPYASIDVAPDIQITMHPWDKYSRTNWTDAQRALIDAHGGTIVTYEISFNSAGSIGSVSLGHGDDDNSMTDDVPAVFDGPYLKDGMDALPLLWAAEFMRDLMRNESASEILPGEKLQNASELIEYVRCGAANLRREGESCDRSSMIVDHLCCSARMGTDPRDRGNATGVVDDRLRVYGVRNLRIADASIFPVLPSGNSHASCMMVGERAAEFLIEDSVGY